MEPLGPPMPPGALAGPPQRSAGPRGAPRGPLRTGRGGAGHTDPDTRAQAEPPARTPPTVWTGGRPGPATMGPADVPPPPPSIPIRPQPPGPLPQGMRPSDVPPFLRPPPPPAQTAEHLAPMAPAAPTPRPAPAQPSQPTPAAPRSVAEHAPPARGSRNDVTRSASTFGTMMHADKPGRLPDQMRAELPETELKFNPPGQPGPDMQVVGGKHPSDYPRSTWPRGVDFADFKPDTPGGRATFRRDQRTKWPMPVHMVPYDPQTGKLR